MAKISYYQALIILCIRIYFKGRTRIYLLHILHFLAVLIRNRFSNMNSKSLLIKCSYFLSNTKGVNDAHVTPNRGKDASFIYIFLFLSTKCVLKKAHILTHSVHDLWKAFLISKYKEVEN